MEDIIISPRFSETDALTHIGNTVIPVWFEHGRSQLMVEIHPGLDARTWPLILAHIDVDYIQQIYVGNDVRITSKITKIGTKSFTVHHEAWQNEKLAAKGNAVMVFFDYETNSTVDIPAEKRKILEQYC